VSTLRIAPRDKYTNVPRETAEDSSLTWGARGLLLWLLSKPDDWRIDRDVLVRESPDGQHVVRRLLKELRDHHYLVRKRVRGDKGRFTTETWLYNRPRPDDEGAENEAPPPHTKAQVTPLVDFRPVDNRPAEDPPAEDRPVELITKELITKTENPSAFALAGEPQAGKGVACIDGRKPVPPSEDQKAAAREIVRAWWDAQSPSPVSHFIGVVQVVASFIAAGYPLDRVIHALNDASVPTKNSLLLELRRDKPSRNKPMPPSMVDAWRTYAVTEIPAFREAVQNATR
jgi:hypothetical protein